MCIIFIGKGESTNVVCPVVKYRKRIYNRSKLQMRFLLSYFCLLIITAIAIIKVNAMIVTATRATKSKYIIASKVSSTIRLTSFYVGGKPHLLIIIFVKKSSKIFRHFSHLVHYIIFIFLIHIIISFVILPFINTL